MSYTGLGLQFLRLLPLMSSTAGVMCAWDQQFAFQSWIDKRVPPGPAGQTLPHWFPVIFKPLIWVVGVMHIGGGILGLLNSVGPTAAGLDNETRLLYFLGGAFAIGHLVYGKWAMAIIYIMWDKSLPGSKNLAQMPPWLRLNWWRIHTNNWPAFFFFLTAVMKATQLK